MNFFTVVIAIAGLLPACSSRKQVSMTGTWIIYKIDSLTRAGNGTSDFDSQLQFSSELKKGITLNFFEDHRFTEITGENGYRFGRWKTDTDNRLFLSDNNNNSEVLTYELKYRLDQKMELTLVNTTSNRSYTFLKQSLPLASFKDDPFYPDNNQWRIKPATAENEAALNNRLMNYLKHLALIMKAAKERNLRVVSFQASMGPVKIYNGGIGIHSFESVPSAWKETYFDSSNALSAYTIYRDYLTKNRRYQGAMTGEWIQDDYNILLAVYADLAKAK